MIAKVLFAAVIAATALSPALAAQNDAPGKDRVCLVTFSKAATEANVDVTDAKILPRKAAQAQSSDTSRIYEYGSGGSLTAEACGCLGNADTRASCDQPLRTD